jgi:hypothetical protein
MDVRPSTEEESVHHFGEREDAAGGVLCRFPENATHFLGKIGK